MMPHNSRLDVGSAAKAKPVFPPSHWKYLLKLLGIIVVADKKIFKEKVDSYLEVVAELRYVIDPTINLTPHMARDWLFLNKQDLFDIIDGLTYDTVLLDILSDIKSLPYKLDVITGMVKIAIADGHYSNIEKGLIKKTILYWNVETETEGSVDFNANIIIKNQAIA